LIYRWEVLKQWMGGNRNGVTGRELLHFLTEPVYSFKAKRMIESVVRRDSFLEVGLVGFENPLYYPAELPVQSLWLPLAEEFYPGNWHEYEIEQTRVGPEDVVLDCGAAEGLFSFHVAPRCRHVYAVEPLPRFVEALELTFRNYPNVEIMPVALSDHIGQGWLNQKDISSSLGDVHENSTCVDLDTVDNLFHDRGVNVDYIKADLEGSELQMLKGAERTIKRNRPKMAITTYHDRAHAGEIDELLRGFDVGYRTFAKGVAGRWGVPMMIHAWPSDGRPGD